MAASGPAFLFDLDGTICDSKPGIVLSLRHALASVGHSMDPSMDLGWCVGPPLQESLVRLLEGGGPDLVTEALGHYRRRYQATGIYENELYPGMREALELLAAKARLFVATSKPQVFALEIIRHFGLEALFRGVYGSGLDGSRSDKADLIAFVLQTEGLDPSETLMIGDREHDMVGASRNGLQALGVLWGYGSKEALMDAGAWRTIEAPSELPLVLLSGLGKAR